MAPDAPTKLVAVCWDAEAQQPWSRRERLIDRVAPALLATCRSLSVCVRDEPASKVPSPSPFPLGVTKPVAILNIWQDVPDAQALSAALDDAGFRCAVYRVEASVYRDYGDNRWSGPRDWPDGTRSPGVTVVSFLRRPARLDQASWLDRWFGRMSPVSEAIQPRQRYVRNIVLEPLTPEAPAFDGIVEEHFADAQTITSPFRFYGADNLVELLRHMGAIMAAVQGFTDLWTVQAVPMSEWFVRTPGFED